MTPIVVTSVLNTLRANIPPRMKEGGTDEVIVDAVAAPKAIDRIAAVFNVGKVEYIRCAQVEGVRWLCAPAAQPLRPNNLVELKAADQK